jgi:hypothetical protein
MNTTLGLCNKAVWEWVEWNAFLDPFSCRRLATQLAAKRSATG